MTEIEILTQIHAQLITMTDMVQIAIETVGFLGGLLSAGIVAITWKG